MKGPTAGQHQLARLGVSVAVAVGVGVGVGVGLDVGVGVGVGVGLGLGAQKWIGSSRAKHLSFEDEPAMNT